MGDALQAAREGLVAFNSHDAARIRATYAEDVMFEAPGDVRTEGADATTAYAMGWQNAFPDSTMTVLNEFASGDWVVQQITFEGTHTETLSGPEGDIPATGKHLAGRGVQVIRIRDGKIAEEHLYYDQMQVLGQLGLIPEAAAIA